MSTPPQNPGSTAPPSAAQINSALSSALSDADASTAAATQSLKLVQQAKVSQLTRNAAALNAQYGPNDARTVAAQARVVAGNAAVARIGVASQQVATPAPTVAATGWALQGRVYDAQLQPAAQLTVFLVDATKTFQQQYGFAYTDATGYFLINYANPAGQAAQTPPLYVEIANAQGEPVYLATAPFQPAAGSTTYQTISLATGNAPLGDPPAEIKRVAIPPQAVNPVTPVTPIAPVAPVTPVAPVAPIVPVIPVAPISPVIPVAPVIPVTPVIPVKPVIPVAPVIPVVPVKPILPIRPILPLKPLDPKEKK